MKSSFYSTAAFGVVLLLGTTGLGRRAQMASPQGGQAGAAPHAAALVKQTTGSGAQAGTQDTC